MIRRFIRFCAGGAVGFGVQLGTLAGLLHAGLPYLPATFAATEAAIICNFLWHRQYTFQSHAGGRALVRYNVVAGSTSLLSSIVVTTVLVERLYVSPLLANAVAIALTSGINFAATSTWVFRSGVVVAALAAAIPAQARDDAATLQPRTLQSFGAYAAAVEIRLAGESGPGTPFLSYERRSPSERARILTMLRRGEVFVERGEPARDAAGRELAIEDGSIHHWRGTVFVPHVSLDELLRVLQEPQTDRHVQEDVLSSRVIAREGNRQKVFLRLRRTRFVTVVYDTEYDVEYRRLSPDRAASTSLSTRIVEIEHAGTPRERALPEGRDHGYMWRLNSYWRYRVVPGGVMVEVESLTLSRDMPAIVGPLITPIVNSTARESMARTLASVRARFAH